MGASRSTVTPRVSAAIRSASAGDTAVPHRCVLADARRARRDPRTSPLASAEFATFRDRLIKRSGRA
jgi:hypothetical protein